MAWRLRDGCGSMDRPCRSYRELTPTCSPTRRFHRRPPAASNPRWPSCTSATERDGARRAGCLDGRRQLRPRFCGQAVSLRGIGGAAHTAIDCAGSAAGAAVRFTSGETAATILDGFEIRSSRSTTDGGAIRIAGASSPTITNCIIRDASTTATGGAIFIDGGDTRLFNLTIMDCTADGGGGGGIAIINGANVRVVNASLQNNAARGGDGGGLRVERATVTIESGIMRNNSASGDGGGLAVLMPDLFWSTTSIPISTITGNSVLAENTAEGAGGGIVLRGRSSLHILDCSIQRNRASSTGGAVHLEPLHYNQTRRRSAHHFLRFIAARYILIPPVPVVASSLIWALFTSVMARRWLTTLRVLYRASLRVQMCRRVVAAVSMQSRA